MSKYWWKIIAVVFVLYSVIFGLLVRMPDLAIIGQSIRNLFFHVPMWFAMMSMFSISAFYSISFLSTKLYKHDIRAGIFVGVGLVFGCLGLATGMEWARFTWGEPWSNDPKQLGSALCMLTFFAYLVLRGSISNQEQRGRVAAVYNIFAFALMIPFIYILPSITDSLHPGSGGNAGFNVYGVDGTMRMILYPAAIGWILIGVWTAQLRYRMHKLQNQILDTEW